MSEREAFERRLQLATRQSGRGPYRRRLMSGVRQMPNVELPAPPPIRRPRGQYVPPTPQSLSPLPDTPPTHQRPPTTATFHPLAEQQSTQQKVSPTPSNSQGHGYVPAGYRDDDATPPSVSTLSEGGFTEYDMELEDETNAVNNECRFVYDDLHIPEGYRVSRVRGYATDDSDLECAPPSDIFHLPRFSPKRFCGDSNNNVTAVTLQEQENWENDLLDIIPQEITNTSIPATTTEESSMDLLDNSDMATSSVSQPMERELFTCLRNVDTQTSHVAPTLIDVECQINSETFDVATQAYISQVHVCTNTPAPPFMYDAGSQSNPPSTSDVAVDVGPRGVVMPCNRSVWTGELPRPYLATPPVDIVRLAEFGQRIGSENPLLSVSALSDRITIACGIMEPNQRRVIDLCTRYGAELLRREAEQLLVSISARYGDRVDATHQVICTALTDHLHAWCRRPHLTSEIHIDPVADEDRLKWLGD